MIMHFIYNIMVMIILGKIIVLFLHSELPKKIKQTRFEIDSIYGLNNDENKINDKIKFYKDILPVDLIPIADLPGGDLICIGMKGDKQNKIYIWFHEMNGENVFLVSNSFGNFIKNFKPINVEKNNLDDVKLNMSDKLNAFLNNASKNTKRLVDRHIEKDRKLGVKNKWK